jgi:hypothetical protein
MTEEGWERYNWWMYGNGVWIYRAVVAAIAIGATIYCS